MRLEQYTKEELIWLIRKLCAYSRSDHDLRRAVNELKYVKELERLDKAEKELSRSVDAYREYADLLAPYNGMPEADIPLEVLTKASAALMECLAASAKWKRLRWKCGESRAYKSAGPAEDRDGLAGLPGLWP